MTTDAIQDILTSAFESQMNNVHTAIPCIVVSVDLINQMVAIQPSVNQLAKDGTIKERPVIQGVPISFPVSKTAGMTFPVKVGDTGMAVFSMRNMDTWKAGNGRPSTPANYAKMDKGDAVFYPGIQPPSVAVNNPAKHILNHDPNDTVMFNNLGTTEVEVRLKVDGSLEINTTNMPVTINCSDVTVNASGAMNLNAQSLIVDIPNSQWVGNIIHTGNYTQTGIASFNGIVFSTHVHGSSPPPSNP